MSLGLKIFIAAVLIILLAAVAVMIYLFISPKPVVKLLRRQLDDKLSVPGNYDDIKKNISIEKDLAYSSAYGKNTLDLYYKNQSVKSPVVLWVHGGAFVAGDKAGVENWAVMLAENGFKVAAMNYQLAPEAAYPKQVEQVCSAFEKLDELKEKYSLDMNHIIIAGDSAGAHIASQFILVHSNSDFSKNLGLSSPIDKNSLKGALLFCGPYDLKSMLGVNHYLIRYFVNKLGQCYIGGLNWKKSKNFSLVTPMNFVTSDFVPCYITDGNKGSFEAHGKALAQALKNCGVDTEERFFPPESGEVNHEYQMQLADKNADLCFQDAIRFLNKYTGKQNEQL